MIVRARSVAKPEEDPHVGEARGEVLGHLDLRAHRPAHARGAREARGDGAEHGEAPPGLARREQRPDEGRGGHGAAHQHGEHQRSAEGAGAAGARGRREPLPEVVEAVLGTALGEQGEATPRGPREGHVQPADEEDHREGVHERCYLGSVGGRPRVTAAGS
jgi:hypothetical protein